MKYFVYDKKDGCSWFDDVKEAAAFFNAKNFESGYTSIGFTEGLSSVDVIYKAAMDDEVVLETSRDFISSGIYQEIPDQVTKWMENIYGALNISRDLLRQAMTHHMDLSDEELEMGD